jgi:PKD repeat protein
LGRTAFLIVVIILVLSVFNFAICSVRAAEETAIEVVDAQTGLNSTFLGDPDESIPPGGYNFTVNVVLNGLAPSLFVYQITLGFNKSALRCDTAWIPKTDPNWVFYGRQTIESTPYIDNLYWGDVFMGSSLLTVTSATNVSQGVFAKVNFTAFRTGSFSINVVPTGSSNYPDDSFLMKTDFTYIPFISQNFTVTVAAKTATPVASFSYTPSHPKANQTVSFDASSSFDPDGSIVSYKWDFGDDNVSIVTSATINHTYISNNAYNVALTVFDNDGFNSSTVNIIMIGEIPSPHFSYEPLNPYRGNTTTFNASQSFDSDGSISLYVWDFADGTNQTTSEPAVTHVFVENGVFTVRLTVFDNDGLHNSTTKQVFVGKAPIAEFALSPENPLPDEEIIFDASLSYDLDGQIVHVAWDFGDWNVTEVDVASPVDLVVAHTYVGQGGIYSVNLTVFDNDGLYTPTVHDVNVTIIMHPGYQGYRSIMFNLVWEHTVYKVPLSGNSTVTHFNFNQSLAQIRFEVSGETGTAGYCNVTIPKTLLRGNPWIVKVDGEPWTYSLLENSSHYFIYFNYTHASTLQVTIQGTWVVPEFPPTVILPLFMLLTTLFLAITRKKIKRLHTGICR